MPTYHLHRDGQNYGPYSAEQMEQLVLSGQVAENELICLEGGSEWIPVSTLMAGAPGTVSRSTGSRVLAVTQQQVDMAYQKVKMPMLGMLFSAGLPVILWAAKSDSERGVRTSGKHRAIKELAKENTDLLPIAIVIGLIGVVVCAVWYAKSLKRAKALKTELNSQ